MKKVTENFLNKFINIVEKGGNALPHPALLFGIFAVLVLIISAIGHLFNWHGLHPANGNIVTVNNLISKEGLHKILLLMVENYVTFAPLGIVMIAMLGIGLAENSGLIKAAINSILVRAPKKLITFFIAFAGIMSNAASDLGYILIIPLAGVIFNSLGRHPIAGISVAFAGVSGGFSANLLIGSIDPLLSGLSTEAARIIDPNYYVMPTCNYYFMAVSTFVIAITGTLINDKFIEPRLGKYNGEVKPEPITPPTNIEKRGLRRVFYVLLFWIILFFIGLYPDNGILRGTDNTILHSPLLKGFISVLFIVAASCGIVYGYTVQSYKNSNDVINSMGLSFKSLVSYLVLVFFAAQFVAWFKWSNLGLIIAVKGAEILKNFDLGLIPLAILFIIFSGFINLFMGSASAKWAILGPVFIPMFMLLGYSPELSQAIFRIGDSVTNVISPMMSFFALIITYYQKYDSKAGIGSIIATMLPYSVSFFLVWTLLLIVWIILGLPLGPEAGIYYQP